MAIARDAAVPELADAVEPALARPLGRQLRRYAPIGIGILMAATMIVIAAAAPLLAPLSPSASDLVPSSRGSRS